MIILDHNWSYFIVNFGQKISGTFDLETDINTSSVSDKKVAFIGCEFLIANTGGILISSNQIKNLKLIQLPEHIIVKAKTSQFASDVSEGMSKLKAFYSKNIPTNITTLNAKNSDKESPASASSIWPSTKSLIPFKSSSTFSKRI